MSTTYAILKQRRLERTPHRRNVLSNQVLAVLVFIATELMFFTALISAYMVIRAGAGDWVPPEGIRLPVLATAFNTFMLFLSGATISYVGFRFDKTKVLNRKLFILGILFASFFVVFQGVEWFRLVSHGMTFVSDIFGATFYLVIGSHAVHAVSGIIAMLYVLQISKKPDFSISAYRAMTLFWLFVVGVWPVLYRLVYFK